MKMCDQYQSEWGWGLKGISLGNVLESLQAPMPSRFTCSQCYKTSPNGWMEFTLKLFCGKKPQGDWIYVWLSNTEEMNVSKTVWPQKLQVTKLLIWFFHTELWLSRVHPGNFFIHRQEVRQALSGEAGFIKPDFLWVSYSSVLCGLWSI